jgi:hypothetical protein
MSYILSSSGGSSGFTGYPVAIAEGGTGSVDGASALEALTLSGGAMNGNSVKSLTAPTWGDPLVFTGDPTFDTLELFTFLSNLGVINA